MLSKYRLKNKLELRHTRDKGFGVFVLPVCLGDYPVFRKGDFIVACPGVIRKELKWTAQELRDEDDLYALQLGPKTVFFTPKALRQAVRSSPKQWGCFVNCSLYPNVIPFANRVSDSFVGFRATIDIFPSDEIVMPFHDLYRANGGIVRNFVPKWYELHPKEKEEQDIEFMWQIVRKCTSVEDAHPGKDLLKNDPETTPPFDVDSLLV